MQLSTKGRYAVMAMTDLAARESERATPLAEIAERQQISLAYLEQLFARLRRRGLVAEDYAADLFIFDPATVGSEPARLVHDLPGDAPRLIAASVGVVRVMVNGVETVRDGAPTGAVPGSLLHSGRDTASVVPAAV